ncbi:MAG: hypothetical protein BAJALOKI1v1_440023 [Promethearchaeota archaeon]|nr:MAG: hypothetical protein BAJALOKI1v1_440023 [Candidatus Lokiarchaeota archaeon]
MKRINSTFKELIKGKKLTFLVGAGCSVDAPSCLPAGRAMMESIINYTCAESEIETLLSIKELRFEQLVEIVRDQLDPELKIIEYYGLCDTPNLQHFFLAEMLAQGHFVMTTNFDFLIEYALEQTGIPRDTIVPVITRYDFEIYSDPDALFREGKKAVYKIHGAAKNVITQENTKDALVVTIQAFGSGKEGETIFQVEPFKHLLFDNITRERSLVVIGYSGSDDFDIIPTLKILKNIKNIFWITHDKNIDGQEKIYKIGNGKSEELESLDKLTQILNEIYRMGNVENIYRIEANTSKLLGTLLDIHPLINSIPFNLSLIEWFNENIDSGTEFSTYAIPSKIYFDFNFYDDSLRCSRFMLSIAESLDDLNLKSYVLNLMGLINLDKGLYSDAIDQFEEALEIDNNLKNLYKKAGTLINIGKCQHAQGKYEEALKFLEEALDIAEEIDEKHQKAVILNNIGLICMDQSNYSMALNKFEEALRIAESLGKLSIKTGFLNNIGSAYRNQGKYQKALEKYEEAYNIAEQLGDVLRKIVSINNIATIQFIKDEKQESLRKYEEALEIAKKIGSLPLELKSLNNIAVFNLNLQNYEKALNLSEEALHIAEEIGEPSEKAKSLNTIGGVYIEKGKYSMALEKYETLINLDKELEDPRNEAIHLSNIGVIKDAQGSFSDAIKYIEDALGILIRIGLGNSELAKGFKTNIEIIRNKKGIWNIT